MSWLVFAILTIICYAVFDLFVKLSGERIHAGLGGFLINLVATIVLLIFIIFLRLRGENIPSPKPHGVLYAILAGIAVGFTTIFFMKMFAAGVNLSIGIPFVRIGIVLLASILGVVLLKEGITLRYLLGFAFALIGLYLLVAK